MHRPDRPTHRMQQRTTSTGRGRHTAAPRVPARPTSRRSAQRWFTLTSVALASLLAVPTAMAVSNHVGSNAKAAAPVTSDLVVNGGFEQGVTGWRTNLATQRLTSVNPGAVGDKAVKATNNVLGNVIVNDKVNTVTHTQAKQTYDVTATVRSTGPFLSGALSIREYAGGHLVSQGQKAFYVNRTWEKVDLGFVTTTAGSELDLNVLSWRVPVGTGLVVDAVHMTRRSTTTPPTTPPTTVPTTTTTTAPTTTTTTAPTTTTTTTTTAPTTTTTTAPTTTVPTTTTPTTPPTTCVDDPMGLPDPGAALLGAAVGGTIKLDQREGALGETLPIDRNYYNPDQIDWSVQEARTDLANDRLPWMSFKLPYSWADMANGRGDAWTAQLIDKLATLDGPVWLAFHHEPEGDGPIQDWTAMQQHLAPIVHNRSNNIAYSVIYTSWDAFGGDPQLQINNTWPGDQYVDILGLDMYNGYGATRNGVLGKKMMDPMQYMGPASNFADAHGVRWGVAEIGYTKEASDVDPYWLHGAYHDLVNNDGVGMSYFDSSANSIADWTLNYQPKFNKYKELMPESLRAC